MSRLIVKNIPPYVTPARLRQHFEQKGAPGGTITDIKVSFKPDGTSRRFGFVGFKTDKEASTAKDWFDRTFIDSTRINVVVVEASKDAPTPRPNKRRRMDSSKDDHPDIRESKPIQSKNETAASNPVKEKSDPNLDEFMKVMQPRTKKGPSWANEASQHNQALLPPVVDVTPVPVEENNQEGDEGKNDEGISDLDWMKRRMTQKMDNINLQERVFQQSDDEDEDRDMNAENQTAIPEEEKDPTKETILQTSRLFLRNLAFSCTDSELMELFQPFGEISQVHIPLDPRTKQPKGLAYVTFSESSAALAAYEALDKKSFQGRLLHILPAVTRKGKIQDEDQEGKKKSLKGEKDAKRKASAGREFNWSMLYMNSDAVVSSVADRMNIAKSDILNPESDNAAVKLALAETHIIQETKTYFESQGVVLSSFSSKARSDTTILVKNIPYGTTAEQIREMFEPHGQLSRVLLPPAGTMAVVEFAHPDEASKAFRAVAYRRLGNSVVYLEKGPLGMFQDTGDTNEPTGQPKISTSFKPVTISEQEADGPDGDDEPSLSAGSTLFVKNISFSTTSDRFTQVFRNLPSFAFARVQTKPDPKRPAVPGVEAPRLSMGYGFVGFKTADAAQKALKSMQGFVLDGHALHVKFAGRGAEEDEGKDKGKTKSNTTKMIVKNMPFEATKKDIRELFGAHGQLKSVRLPKKFDSRSRGFAFLEFVTRHEAENAYAMLRHTHLLGRHLVLQWAEEGEQDLDVLRKKVGVGYGDGSELPGRKRKLVFDEDGDGDGGGGDE
ncbi:hypothetical protein SERLADRAFT_459485 [Serpula lacrymans var. lacrymans S7.9]|uniref:Multiple RNA-binding domain-containing protein 1 n=1 Tax=Serpula lacrymans var. lacrymans (strain S7.9) TaxID=578457 RepID=F8NK55_SERL9|nr:uncharacterized protein SERLADRAFT_459485 [Serpula lacrymans var. lacrymans S7.9]EGO28739.1 hypothetical protein SERLADRAFT_459485 [Serpula lacrymans var. lacrymans S7.9]